MLSQVSSPSGPPGPFPHTRSHTCPPYFHLGLQDGPPCPVGQDPLPERVGRSEPITNEAFMVTVPMKKTEKSTS